jgi:hypothetical protein
VPEFVTCRQDARCERDPENGVPVQGLGRCSRSGPIRAPAARRSRAGSRASDLLCQVRRRATCHVQLASGQGRNARVGVQRMSSKAGSAISTPTTSGARFRLVASNGGPSLHDLVLVRWPARHCRRCRLIEERLRKVAKIEKPSIDTLAPLQMLQDPIRGLLRETALAGAPDNDGNAVMLLLSLRAHSGIEL